VRIEKKLFQRLAPNIMNRYVAKQTYLVVRLNKYRVRSHLVPNYVGFKRFQILGCHKTGYSYIRQFAPATVLNMHTQLSLPILKFQRHALIQFALLEPAKLFFARRPSAQPSAR
jgi:hypothetical protein